MNADRLRDSNISAKYLRIHMCDKMVVLGILEIHKFHQMHGSSWAHMIQDYVHLKKDH